MGKKESVLVGRPEGKRPLGRRRHRQDNVKMALKEIGENIRTSGGFC
jgi:hypothetical protein